MKNTKMRYAGLAFLLLILISGKSFGQATLRAGDTIEIRLSGAPVEDVQQFSASYTIDDQGMLNLPFINDVRAGGLQANQVQTAIESRLRSEKIFTHPTITIVVGSTSRFVNIGGAVRSPQRVPYTPDLTLMSAINAVGGPNEFADQKRVRLVRNGKAILFDTRQIRKDPSTDPKLLPGDQVEVPQSLW